MRFSGYDKPHRCPTCWAIPDVIWEKHNSARRFWLYQCRNGHRFMRMPAPTPKIQAVILMVAAEVMLFRLAIADSSGWWAVLFWVGIVATVGVIKLPWSRS